MVKLDDYDCIGFDLDHTVIQYKLDNLYSLTYKCLMTHLVKEKGYDTSLLDSSLDDNKDFILRGLILDVNKGNLIKLDKHGCILRASHGTKQMSDEEIKDCYGEERKFLFFEELKSFMIKRHKNICNFRTFENFFDLPGALAAAKLVDVIDAKNGRPDKYTFWPDIMEAFIINFSPSSFAAKIGDYFPTLTKNPSHYIKPCSKELISWIKSLSTEKCKVFLLTNSYIDYANFLLEHAVGKEWQDLFDLVICKASKPGFFVPFESGKSTPFYEIEGMKEVQETHKLQLKKTYSQGNLETLMEHLKKWTKKDDPKVLYFGDSAKSDIYPTSTLAKWDVAAVLEEMETEGMVTTSHDQLEENDGPKTKRPKLLELDVEEGKEEILLSDQWGSLFTDNSLLGRPCVNGLVSTAKHTDVPIKTEGHFYHEMGTFWGDLIRQCSTIAIPTADFITGCSEFLKNVLHDDEAEVESQYLCNGLLGLSEALLPQYFTVLGNEILNQKALKQENHLNQENRSRAQF